MFHNGIRDDLLDLLRHYATFPATKNVVFVNAKASRVIAYLDDIGL
jgi:hypothetical protein